MSSSTTGKTLQVIFEVVLNSKTEDGLDQDATQSLLEPVRKRRGDNMWKPDTENMDRTINETRTDKPKGDDSRLPIYIWDMRAWTYECVGFRKDLNIIWEGMLRSWRHNLMR